MGTDFYHPGTGDMNDRRDEEVRTKLLDTVNAIDRRTSRMEIALFGPDGQGWMGHINRTEIRLAGLDDPQTGRVAKIERRILLWIGAMSIIGPAAALAVNYWMR